MQSESFYPSSGIRRLKDSILLFWLASVIIIGLALISYNPADNNWLNDPNGAVHILNMMGPFGAKVSSALFSYFGYCAYGLVVLLLYIDLVAFKHSYSLAKMEYGIIAVRIIGFNFLLISSCTLVAKTPKLDMAMGNNGGHLGYLIFDIIYPYMGYNGTILIMVAMFVSGFTLFTGSSIVAICTFIGSCIFAVFDLKNTMKNIWNWITAKHSEKENNSEDENHLNLNSAVSDENTDDFAKVIVVPEDDANSDKRQNDSQAEDLNNKSVKAADAKSVNSTDSAHVEKQEDDSFMHVIPAEDSVKDQTNDCTVDYSRPDIGNPADASLTIPGIGAADPEAPVKQNPVQKKAEAKRVEPSFNISDVDSVPERLADHAKNLSFADAEKAVAAQETVENKKNCGYVRTVVLPARHIDNGNTSADSDNSGFNQKNTSSVAENLSRENHSVAENKDNLTNTESELENGMAGLAEVKRTPVNDDSAHFDHSEKNTSNIINISDAKNESKGESLGVLPVGFTPVENNDALNHGMIVNNGVKEINQMSLVANANDHNEMSGRTAEEEQSMHSEAVHSAPVHTNVLPSNKFGEVRFVKSNDVPDEINYGGGHYEVDSENLSPLPSTAIFNQPKSGALITPDIIEKMVRNLDESLRIYKIKAHVACVPSKDEHGNTIMGGDGRPVMKHLYECGPVITRFLLELEGGQPASKIAGLSTDIARNLCVPSIRVVMVVAGTPYVGIEIPHDQKNRRVISMRQVLESPEFQRASGGLQMCLGQNIIGKPAIYDLTKAPHLLVAGTTGSGKSVGINAMLVSMMMKHDPETLRLILVDPKMLEFSVYHDVPHLLTPVITDIRKAGAALRWAVKEMDRRYDLMSRVGSRNISGFNQIIKKSIDEGSELLDPTWHPTDSMAAEAPKLKPLPYIVIVVDEFADLILQLKKNNDVNQLLSRLAAKARACGIHLILSTQSPRKEIISGALRANFPSQISFRVKSSLESRIILDEKGAESLLGQGDMLIRFSDGTNTLHRAHGAFITDEEIARFCEAWRARGVPEYINEVTEDEESEDGNNAGAFPASSDSDLLYDQVVEFVRLLKQKNRRFSVSMLQRQFSIGYSRASRLADMLEKNGILSEPMGAQGMREILLDSD